jgi:hypothetical protein
MRQRVYTRPGKVSISGDFVCLNCKAFVSADAVLSGVRNRNHCPYCLSSRHLDQFEAGDRLSACKACMHPVGLTFKRTAKKYGSHGELMLVHLCEDCGKVSINRIAADDNEDLILSVLETSGSLDSATLNLLRREEITLLDLSQADEVKLSLFGVGEV